MVSFAAVYASNASIVKTAPLEGDPHFVDLEVLLDVVETLVDGPRGEDWELGGLTHVFDVRTELILTHPPRAGGLRVWDRQSRP